MRKFNGYFIYFFLFEIVALFGCQEKKVVQDSSTVPGVCAKPPLGFNSYDSYGVFLDSKNASALIEVMAKNFLPFGYEYFVIDAGWYNEAELVPGTNYPSKQSYPALDKYGVCEPSKTYFPEGLKVLADKAHGLGLKFGIHLMRGIPKLAVKQNLPVKGTKYHAQDIADTLNICVWGDLSYGVDMSKPGAQEYYNSVFEKFASWGIDFVKVDDMVPYPLEITAIKKAIANCGRPMTYSLSPGDVTELPHLPYYRMANMLRVTGDIWDRPTDMKKAFTAWKKYQGLSSPGFWIDLDMIPFGQLLIVVPEKFAEKPEPDKIWFSHWSRLSKDQMRTFTTIRSLSASPLFIGGNLLNMDDFSYSLLTNKNMLECNQNGVMGINVYDKDSVEIWHVCKATQFGKGWIGIFNRSTHPKEQGFTRSDLGLLQYDNRKTAPIKGNIQSYDIWNDKNMDIKEDGCTLSIPAEGVIFLQYELKNKN